MSYVDDRVWSDKYIAAVSAIIGPRLLVPSSLERDRLEATDLMVLRARDMTIGVRVRRPGYAGRHPGESIVRSNRSSSAQTELKQIRWVALELGAIFQGGDIDETAIASE